MYKTKSIAVVVPCFNEASQIRNVVETMPEFVDEIICVDDCSTDATLETLNALKLSHSKLKVVQLAQNLGVGGAIDAGYGEALRGNYQLIAVMAGDGQMNPEELAILVDALIDSRAQYAKVTRLFDVDNHKKIPKIRLFGNSVLSIMTRLSSGYWNMTDSQTGYTVISRSALKKIQGNLWTYYGFPNDVLNKLGLIEARIVEVPSIPIYGIGEESKLKPRKVAIPILKLLVRGFITRVVNKYLLRSFHPIGIGYVASLLGMLVGFIWLFEILVFKFLIAQNTPPLQLISALILTQSSVIFLWLTLMFDALTNQNNSVLVNAQVD
jgi:glycosyltransferase involved in cell wall biosynthesis